jgi:hypothetical protein
MFWGTKYGKLLEMLLQSAPSLSSHLSSPQHKYILTTFLLYLLLGPQTKLQVLCMRFFPAVVSHDLEGD